MLYVTINNYVGRVIKLNVAILIMNDVLNVADRNLFRNTCKLYHHRSYSLAAHV